ncbi:coiled-coil domain-containing protein 154 isoform X3 [Cervus elaphus]|uniref:coiled-coil domain-containing protein 154 isoform X3 n=1 Tax=Cervus elaphus TaxID=9860 RepID=UPI001CC2D031|nr:coiled-coil domain-containing protein 154 isoform X3 [Cervus elaphus]
MSHGERSGCPRQGLGSIWEQLPCQPQRRTPSYLLVERTDSSPSSEASPPSQLSTIAAEDLGLLEEELASPESLSPEEVSEKDACSRLPSDASNPEQGTLKRWKQLEQWVAGLQAEVASLRGHRARCEHATLSLLRELLQVRACLQLQDAQLKRLQLEARQAVPATEKEAVQVGRVPRPGGIASLDPEPHSAQAQHSDNPRGPAPRPRLHSARVSASQLPGPQQQNQMQALDKRLVEVREALTQVRRKQALQDSERKGAEQETSLRLSELTGKLKQEEQDREVACGALQKSQEEAGQKLDHQVARMQAQMTKLGEEMSLRFLKREARLCGFLQKSFLALEKRMKASESARLRAESALREELEGRWRQLQELDTERVRAQQDQCQQEECHLLEQCRGLDKAVVQLTEFVQQNQVSLNRVLLAEQKAWDAKGQLEDSRAGELATYLQENLEAMQLAGELAQQETHGTLELLREKSQALEVSVAELVRQVKDLSDHFLALSWRLDLQEQTLSMRLRETQNEWEAAEQRWRGGLTRCQEEAEARLREVQERLDHLPQQIEAVTDKCVLHKSDSDCKISAEATARELAVEAVRQELAALLSSVQLLREGNPGRKIAEIQGKLATFQNQMMKLETSIQDNKTIQNLKFNTETKLRAEAMATLQESVLRLWSEEGPWAPTLGSRRGPTSLERQQLFVKEVAPDDVVPVNRWGVYQAVRWLQWKAVLMNLASQQTPGSAALEKPLSQKPARRLSSLPIPQK